MKIESLQHLQIKRLGEDDSIKAGISQESLPFVFDIISRQLYSNPIGSIVREITSNCFDSHKEAGINDPVIIRKSYDAEEDSWYIEFQDFGVGLSPERIESVYMNYFSSTKRDNNEQIGGFGLGSKTPLAYSDLFYIITRFDGIEYSYVFHKGEEKPTLDILSEVETIERNGTIIKIPIKNDSSTFYGNDSHKFEAELKNQLLYFDNVYFENWNVNNDYKIYEAKHFKFRSDIDTKEKKIHICMGKVTYPLNFDKVSLSSHMLPIAIKFEIGEIPVTPSREEIRYNDQTISLINERAKLAIDEVIEMYNAQNPVIEDIVTFLRVRDTKPKLMFSAEHGISIYSDSINSNFKFAPLLNIKTKRVPKNLFFEYEMIGWVRDGVYTEKGQYDSDNIEGSVIDQRYIVIDNLERIHKYQALYISEKLGDSRVYVVRRRSVPYEEYCKSIGLLDRTLGKTKIILEYSKIIGNIVKGRGFSYHDMKPSSEWIEERKKQDYESTNAYKRKIAKKVHVRHYAWWRNYAEDISSFDLANRSGITIYGYLEDKEELERVAEIISVKPSFSKKSLAKDKMRGVIVIRIAKNVEKLFKENKRAIHVSKFYNTKIFKKIATAKFIKEEVEFSTLWKYSKYFRGLEPKLKALDKFLKSNYRDMYINPNPIHIAKEKNIEFLPEYVNLVGEVSLDKYTMPPLIQALYSFDGVEKEVVEYLKLKGIKLINKHYLKPINEQTNVNTEEESTIEETREDSEENSPEAITEESISEENSTETRTEEIINSEEGHSSEDDRNEPDTNDRREEVQQEE